MPPRAADLPRHPRGPPAPRVPPQLSASRVAIVGPTGVGKTRVAVEVALRTRGEIVAVDSRQVFAGIATASNAATADELRGVPQHLVAVIPPSARVDAAIFAAMARATLAELAGRGVVAVLTAGTGLYLRALTRGLDLGGTGRDPVLRAELERRVRSDLPGLVAELGQRDPAAAARVDEKNAGRVVRQLELAILRQRGATRLGPTEPLPTPMVGLTAPLPVLTGWIRERAERMWEAGIVDEVRRLLREDPPPGRQVLESVGVAEVVAHLEGRLSREEATEAMVKRTRAYARRQLTWFRAEPVAAWIDVSRTDLSDIVERVTQLVAA